MVVGLGMAGAACALAAVEGGAKVAVLQKGEMCLTHGNFCAVINSPEFTEAGCETIDVDEMMKQFNAMAPDEKTAEAFGELAEEHSDDGRNDDGTLYTKGGLYENIHKGDMVENFNNWIFDALPARRAT